jgi:hypothetical protein
MRMPTTIPAARTGLGGVLAVAPAFPAGTR